MKLAGSMVRSILEQPSTRSHLACRSAVREGAYEYAGSQPFPTHREGCCSRYAYCPLVRFLPVLIIYAEGYIGMALVGGAAAVGTILLAGLIRRAARK